MANPAAPRPALEAELAAFELYLDQRCDTAINNAERFLSFMHRVEEITDSVLARHGLYDPAA